LTTVLQDEDCNPRQWPESVEEAVTLLRAHVPHAEQSRIAALPQEALIDLHFDLGAWIRCTFGLSTGNDELLDATGCKQANDACDVVIEAFWNALRSEYQRGPHASGRARSVEAKLP
jgi:hypothetical protein